MVSFVCFYCIMKSCSFQSESHSNFNSNILRLDLIFVQYLEFCLHHHPTCFRSLLHFVFLSFWRLLVAQFCKCAHIRDIRGAFSARYAEADIYGQTFAHERHEPDLRHITNIYSRHMCNVLTIFVHSCLFLCVCNLICRYEREHLKHINKIFHCECLDKGYWRKGWY